MYVPHVQLISFTYIPIIIVCSNFKYHKSELEEQRGKRLRNEKREEGRTKREGEDLRELTTPA